VTFVPFQAADHIGDRFLALLSKLGIHPPPGSALEDELLSLAQLIEVMKNPSLALGPNQVAVLRSAAGLYDLAAKVLSVEPIDEFSTFVPHLRLIAETKVRAASLGQNAASGAYDDTARKIAELYMGCLAAHVGSHVVLDSPTEPKGDNPDVIFTVEECHLVKQPQKWALAIKTIASRQGQTIFERIKEGADQIDRPKCRAEKGMVVINAKSALDHDALWNASFPHLTSALNAIEMQLDRLADNASADRPQAEWDGLFRHKVVRPVLFLGQSLVRLPTPAGAQTPTALKMLRAYGADGTLDPVGFGLARVMNDFMQNILLGIPGGPGRAPK
jgi:hypothetical protein